MARSHEAPGQKRGFDLWRRSTAEAARARATSKSECSRCSRDVVGNTAMGSHVEPVPWPVASRASSARCSCAFPPPVSFSPPNAPPISAPLVPMLTLAMPQSEPAGEQNSSASRTSLVKIADDSPAARRCGSRSLRRGSVAHDVEDRGERFLLDDRRLWLDLDDRRPHVDAAGGHVRRSRGRRRGPCRPAAFAASSAASMASAARFVDQRADERAARPWDRRSADVRRRFSSRSRSSSAIDSWTIRRRSVVQRWPQVPTAAKTIERTASSRSADGATIIAVVAAEFEQRAAEPLRRRLRRRPGPSAPSRWRRSSGSLGDAASACRPRRRR